MSTINEESMSTPQIGNKKGLCTLLPSIEGAKASWTKQFQAIEKSVRSVDELPVLPFTEEKI